MYSGPCGSGGTSVDGNQDMSRINEALSRAGVQHSHGSGSTPAGEDVFVSPWRFGGAEPQKTVSGRATTPNPILHVVRSSLVERFRPGWRERLMVWPAVDACLVEQFRRLAATLLQSQRATGLKSVIIASASPGDGKTLTALNLALVLSESYRQTVLLIDADLRRPTIGEGAGLTVTDGLSEAIRADYEGKVGLAQLTETLTLLPAGAGERDPLSGLTSTRMQSPLQDGADKFKRVI